MQEYVIELSKYFIAFFYSVIYGKLFLYLSVSGGREASWSIYFTGSFDVSGAGPLFSEPVPCQRRFSVFVFLCIYTDLSVCYDHDGIADLREY